MLLKSETSHDTDTAATPAITNVTPIQNARSPTAALGASPLKLAASTPITRNPIPSAVPPILVPTRLV
jgi:hypothetical protein